MTNNTMKERLMRLETQIKEHCKTNKDDFDEIKSQLKEISMNVKGLDTKYSAKWVEKGVTIIITAIVLGAIYTIFKNNGIEILL